jgi:hypothetical protein
MRGLDPFYQNMFEQDRQPRIQLPESKLQFWKGLVVCNAVQDACYSDGHPKKHALSLPNHCIAK